MIGPAYVEMALGRGEIVMYTKELFDMKVQETTVKC